MPDTLNISRLGDHQLLASARELARRERHLNLRIIEHLREIGSRGLHLRHDESPARGRSRARPCREAR